jgi:hypothetical protein
MRSWRPQHLYRRFNNPTDQTTTRQPSTFAAVRKGGGVAVHALSVWAVVAAKGVVGQPIRRESPLALTFASLSTYRWIGFGWP